ncbi:12546_t:CDS:2, partial [Gigaspora margarita]
IEIEVISDTTMVFESTHQKEQVEQRIIEEKQHQKISTFDCEIWHIDKIMKILLLEENL